VVWCGEVPLKEALPVLYDIARDKDAHVSFFRAAHDWEVDVLVSLFSLLYSTRVDCDGEDQLW
jgi:hypothetical protein